MRLHNGVAPRAPKSVNAALTLRLCWVKGYLPRMTLLEGVKDLLLQHLY